MELKRWHTSRRLNPTSISTRVRCDAMSVQFPELPLASTQTLTMTPSPRPQPLPAPHQLPSRAREQAVLPSFSAPRHSVPGGQPQKAHHSLKIITEKHPDGCVAEALADVKSAIQFHVETFSKEVLQSDLPVLKGSKQ